MGFSEKLGPLLYAEEEGEVFLGRSVAKANHMSDETARAIDEEIKVIIDRNYKRARQILNDHMDILHAMKDALMKYETIDAPQIDDLMNRRPVRKPAGWDDNDSSNSTATSSSQGESEKNISASQGEDSVDGNDNGSNTENR